MKHMKHITEEQLNDYLDNLLDEPTRHSIQAHLSLCAECHSRLDEIEGVFAKLESLSDIPMPRDLTPLIMAYLPGREPAPVWTRGFAAQSGIVAGFLFWVAVQAIPFVRLPSLPPLEMPIPEIEALIARLLALQFKFYPFNPPDFDFDLPVVQFYTPAIHLPISTSYLVTLVMLALLLWVIGNVILLRNRKSPQS